MRLTRDRLIKNIHQNWQNLTDTIANIDNIGVWTSHLDHQLEWVAHRSTEVSNIYVLKQSRTLAKFDQSCFQIFPLLFIQSLLSRINRIGISLPSGSSNSLIGSYVRCGCERIGAVLNTGLPPQSHEYLKPPCFSCK